MPEMVLAQIGSAFPQMIQNLENMGFFLYLFPFLLTLAIVYGVLSVDEIAKKIDKSARSLIAIVLAFFVMLYSSWNPGIVAFFASFSGAGLILASGLLFLIILLSMVGFDISKIFMGEDKKINWPAILIVVFILAIIFFGAGAGSLIPLPSWSGSSELWTAIFFIVIVALAMWWMSGREGKASS